MTSLPSTMKAALLTAPHTFEVRDVPLPDVPEGWALVKTELTGLCGTDFSIVHGTHPRAQFPLILGHEITGQVALAADIGPEAGTRVVVEPLIKCGNCRPCREGASHVCQHLQLFGIDSPGSLAEYVALPASALVPVNGSAPLKHVALAEPLAVALHAVSGSGLQGGESVVVFGAGPIGVLTALVARFEGAGQVIVVEPSDERRAVVEELGFTTLPANETVIDQIHAATGGDGADIVFDTAGVPPVAALLTKAARVRGTVVLVGVYKKPVEVNLQAVTFAELNLVGVRVYTRDDVERAVELIEDESLPLDRLPVEQFALEDAAQALRTAASSPRALKVFVGTPGGGR
jgi:(R,R)-butanediol dehydrogenase/meso-butanediol dehydrogenase/diacetyl reductase